MWWWVSCTRGPRAETPVALGGGRNNLSMVYAGTLEPSWDTEISFLFREDIQISWVWVTSWSWLHRSDAWWGNTFSDGCWIILVSGSNRASVILCGWSQGEYDTQSKTKKAHTYAQLHAVHFPEHIFWKMYIGFVFFQEIKRVESTPKNCFCLI